MRPKEHVSAPEPVLRTQPAAPPSTPREEEEQLALQVVEVLEGVVEEAEAPVGGPGVGRVASLVAEYDQRSAGVGGQEQPTLAKGATEPAPVEAGV
jgi:hypothetical protein